MRVGIIGCRETYGFTVLQLLDEIPRNCSQIVTGGARGIDTLARECAQKLGIPCREFLPDYEKYGKMAPLRRNDEILAHVDMVLAFWDFASHGTRYGILECQKRGIPCKIIDIRGKKYQYLRFPSPK